MIQTLPRLTPDPQRSARTIARCRDRLARRRKTVTAAAAPATTRHLAVERALVGAFCILYISGVALVAIDVLAGL